MGIVKRLLQQRGVGIRRMREGDDEDSRYLGYIITPYPEGLSTGDVSGPGYTMGEQSWKVIELEGKHRLPTLTIKQVDKLIHIVEQDLEIPSSIEYLKAKR